jgi:hypothetical protein
MPKGEKVLAQCKRTAPPPISKIKEVFFQIGMTSFKIISKTLLNTKRRISLRGSFV